MHENSSQLFAVAELHERAALRIFRDVFEQYRVIREASERNIRHELVEFASDFERMARRSLKPAEYMALLRIVVCGENNEDPTERAISIKLGRALARTEFWPVEGYFGLL